MRTMGAPSAVSVVDASQARRHMEPEESRRADGLDDFPLPALAVERTQNG
jgi:hypothetical protein